MQMHQIEQIALLIRVGDWYWNSVFLIFTKNKLWKTQITEVIYKRHHQWYIYGVDYIWPSHRMNIWYIYLFKAIIGWIWAIYEINP